MASDDDKRVQVEMTEEELIALSGWLKNQHMPYDAPEMTSAVARILIKAQEVKEDFWGV